MPVRWDDAVDAIIAGDLTGALGYRTPAGGVVVQAVAPIGLRDREAGTVGFTTSLGFSKKLDRIGRDPRVAMAYHAREHGFADGPAYVLVQGRARVVAAPTDAERLELRAHAERHLGPAAEGWFWDRWLREYYRVRVPVRIAVERIVAWPDLRCSGQPAVLGAPAPREPASDQAPPRNGTGPRVDVARVARRMGRTRHTLLGWAGADGLPVVAPVIVARDGDAALRLTAATPLPPGAGARGCSATPTGRGSSAWRRSSARDGSRWARTGSAATRRTPRPAIARRRTSTCCCCSTAGWPSAACARRAGPARPPLLVQPSGLPAREGLRRPRGRAVRPSAGSTPRRRAPRARPRSRPRSAGWPGASRGRSRRRSPWSPTRP